MRAFVSDQSSSFGSVDIGTGPDFTIVAALELPPGSWVIFATVAFGSATGVAGTTVVQTGFLLDGEPYGGFVQADHVIAEVPGGATNAGFLVVPLTTGVALDTRRTIQVGCVTTEAGRLSSQPTTITAIQVDSATRITQGV